MSDPIKEIKQGIDALTPADMERVGRTFDKVKPTEELLGVARDEETRRLWALSHVYAGRGVRAHMDAAFTATSTESRDNNIAISVRWNALAELAAQLAWIRLRDEVGGTWGSGSIALREGFQVVRLADDLETTSELGAADAIHKAMHRMLKGLKLPPPPGGEN